MLKSHLALDIETVPVKELNEYSPIIKEKVLSRIERAQDRDPEFSYEYFASIHADFGKIVCISLGYISDDDDIRLKSFSGDDEYQILIEFNKIVDKHQG
ncbi:MAG: 3'-5' exonuclease, partial [Calditrichaeota bacterium]|nr:3'-5' exonuclease [Calditrichota bacterium]